MHELTRPLTAQEERELESRLWQATAKKAALYTSGRSTSLHEDTVKALLNSIRFSLELYFSEQGFPFTAILSQDLDENLSAADASVARAVKRARFQYERACRCAFQDESVALQTTLRGIGMFFHRYDHRFFAAECPCDIDYPLAQSVPEDLQGVLYIRAWLDRLLMEDAFLRRLPPQSVRAVLDAMVPQHRELLVNIYEMAAAAALGATMGEGNLFTLFLTSVQARCLAERFAQAPPQSRRHMLHHAAEKLSRRLELNAGETDYLHATAEALLPRLTAAADAGDLRGVFPVK